MNFKQHIANYVAGNFTTSDLPKIGLAGLQQGLDSESLTILAGMNDKDNAFELEQYFRKALEELNVEIPDKREAAIEIALYYSNEILADRLNPFEGVLIIIRDCLGTYNFSEETKEYAMDSIDFQAVYGLYWSYDDLKEADRQWDKNKSNEELMQEIKTDLVVELKKWQEKMKNAQQPNKKANDGKAV